MSKSLVARSVIALATITLFGSVNADSQAQGWRNPVIWDGGTQFTGIKYNPWNGRIEIETDRTKVRESVTDPNRNNVDPGSYQRVNEYQTDQQGQTWHVTGTRWTSNGVPHGNLRRTRVVRGPGGVDHRENENVIFSPGNTPATKTQQPTTKPFASKPYVQKPWSTQRPVTPSYRQRPSTRQGYNPF